LGEQGGDPEVTARACHARLVAQAREQAERLVQLRARGQMVALRPRQLTRA
jgi:hypothetical protein